MKLDFNIIVAKSENNIIGNNNNLIWYIPEDLKNFKRITSNNLVVMGRKTFDSIGKPLPNRINIVLTKKIEYISKYRNYNNLYFLQSFDDIIEFINKNYNDKKIFIIGGETVYRYFINNNLYNKIYLTEIKCLFSGDAYFPNIDKSIHNKKTIASGEYNGLIYDFNIYTKKSNF